MRIAANALAGALLCASAQAAAQPADSDAVEEALVAIEEASPDARMPLQERLLADLEERTWRFTAIAVDPEASALRRALSGWALAELASEEACEGIAAAALAEVNEAPQDRITFAIGLLRCGDPEPLRALLDPASPVLAAKAAITLAMERDEGAREAIDALRAEPAMADLLLFLDIAMALLGDTSQPETLRALLQQPSARAYAAIALVRQGDLGAVIDVRIAARDPDPWLRYHALEALVSARREGTREVLYAAVDDVSPRVARYAAREARLWRRRVGEP